MLGLKDYQKRTLAVVKRYFEATQFKSPEDAYAQVANEGDVRLRLGNDYGYNTPEGMSGVPTVCIKVPTGGGKTILAAHALKLIASAQAKEYPFVLWFAPSDTIRRQTADALKKPTHPYRRELDSQFAGHVKIFDLDERAIIAPEDIENNLCIVVATQQSFVHKETNKYDVYRHNENFERHFGDIPFEEGMEAQDDDASKPKFSFANLILHNHPVIIVDEAHHMVTNLSTVALARLAPSAVMGLTATPGKDNNIVYTVYAEELFKEEMVKLPIELKEYNLNWEQAVAEAIAKRNVLANDAAKENVATGQFIHPILLFQATSKTGEVPVEKLKAYLVDTLKIPDQEIRIATGEQKELDDIDVMDPKCGVNYIITVQALKEGWDCPFAYVFCSLANVGSSKDTVQLLGRVMRMPYAKKRNLRSLNRAYAFVMSKEFGAAAKELTEGLKSKGFSAEAAMQSIEVKPPEQTELGLDLWDAAAAAITVDGVILDQIIMPADVTIRDNADGSGVIELTGDEDSDVIHHVAEQLANKGAVEVAQKLVAQHAKKKAEKSVPIPAKGKPMVFPKLAAVVDGELLFTTDATYETIGKELPQFLPSAFAQDEISAKTDEGKAFLLSLDGNQMTFRFDDSKYATYLKGFSGEIAQGDVVNSLDAITKDYSVLSQIEKRHWLTQIVADLVVNKGMTCEQIVLARYQVKQRLDYHYFDSIAKAKREAYQEVFSFGTKYNLSLELANGFEFDEHAYDGPMKCYNGGYKFTKHYLGPNRVAAFDGNDDGEEFKCAQLIDSNPKVDFWLRNLANDEHRSFRLPVACDQDWFYPDFIGQLKDGRLFVLEYKGELTGQTVNTIEKDAVGRLWAAQDASKYVYATIYGKHKEGLSVAQQIIKSFDN